MYWSQVPNQLMSKESMKQPALLDLVGELYPNSQKRSRGNLGCILSSCFFPSIIHVITVSRLEHICHFLFLSKLNRQTLHTAPRENLVFKMQIHAFTFLPHFLLVFFPFTFFCFSIGSYYKTSITDL